jgi:hypothetical protein
MWFVERKSPRKKKGKRKEKERKKKGKKRNRKQQKAVERKSSLKFEEMADAGSPPFLACDEEENCPLKGSRKD